MLFVCLTFGGHIISFREMAALDVKEREIPGLSLVSVSTLKMTGRGSSNFVRYLVQILREKGRPRYQIQMVSSKYIHEMASYN